MRKFASNAREYNEAVKLVKSPVSVDEYGHKATGAPVVVGVVNARVRQMSASRVALTFQLADVVGLDFEMRTPAKAFDAVVWRDHVVTITAPEDVDGRGRVIRFSGYYQNDNPGL